MGCVCGSAAACERGRGIGGKFKLLSVNLTPFYLDSNSTCRLSLSPHLSLCLLKPSHTPRLCVQQGDALILFLSLFMCNLPGVTQYYSLVDARPHSLCNPLLSVLPYSVRMPKFDSRQISNMEKENSSVMKTPLWYHADTWTLAASGLVNKFAAEGWTSSDTSFEPDWFSPDWKGTDRLPLTSLLWITNWAALAGVTCVVI